MDLAAIITTLVVVVLQLITVSLIIRTRKMVTELANKKDTGPVHNDRPRRDRDLRQSRKPTQDFKQKSQSPNTTSAGVDPVEKSLRDINLKLKNAERDQENARRKIHDNFSKDNSRRRDGGKGGRDGRDLRGGNRRGNWNERGRRDNSQDRGNTQTDDEQESQAFEVNEELNNLQSLPIQETSPMTDNSSDITTNDFGSEENLQHGRKFSVKRRVVKDDEETQTEDENLNTTATIGNNESEQDSQSQEKNEGIENAAEAEIRFGRR